MQFGKFAIMSQGRGLGFPYGSANEEVGIGGGACTSCLVAVGAYMVGAGGVHAALEVGSKVLPTGQKS